MEYLERRRRRRTRTRTRTRRRRYNRPIHANCAAPVVSHCFVDRNQRRFQIVFDQPESRETDERLEVGKYPGRLRADVMPDRCTIKI